jgi:hypothetical protein
MWLQDLEHLEKEYQMYKQERTCKQTGITNANVEKKKKVVVKKPIDSDTPAVKKTVKKATNTDLIIEETMEITIAPKKAIKTIKK